MDVYWEISINLHVPSLLLASLYISSDLYPLKSICEILILHGSCLGIMTLQFRKIHLFKGDLSTTGSGVSIPMFVITEYSIYFQSLVKHFHHDKYICIHITSILSIYCTCNLSSRPSLVSLLNYLNQLQRLFRQRINPSSKPLYLRFFNQATQF